MTFDEIKALPDKEFLEAIVTLAFSYDESRLHQAKYSITKSRCDKNEYKVWESFLGNEWRWVQDVLLCVSETGITMKIFGAWTYNTEPVDRNLIELLPFEKGAEQ